LLDTELAYAAGLFDGEGTVTAVPFSKHRGSYMLCTRLGMHSRKGNSYAYKTIE